MKKYDVITIGGAIEDITFFVDDVKILKDKKKEAYLSFKMGSKVGIEKTYLSLGGGACNTAVGLASLGLKTGSMVCLGDDDRGDKILAEFSKLKIDTDLVQIDKKNQTGFSFICGLDKTKMHIAFSHRGASESLKINSNELSQVETYWIHTSSLKGKNWMKNLDQIVKYKKNKGIRWSWNPGGTQLSAGRAKLAKFLKECDVLFVNASEAQELAVGSKNSIEKNLIKLSKLGPKIVVITDGANGAYVYDSDKKEKYHHDAKAKKIADTTGAGDAFASGFIGGMLMYDEPQKALKLGIGNSQAVLRKVGAQHGLLTKDDLTKIFK